MQYDALYAFLNASLNCKLYVETLYIFRRRDGALLQVLRALYGLQESPLLWYNKLWQTLLSLGLNAVKGFPYLYTSKELILFIYVDDIIITFYLSNAKAHIEIKQKLVNLYNLRCLGPIKWFLGIRVVRD